ncbi:family 3 glycoside hydrolase [Xylogone sp. PMI_703]|nr:family 3 glycoside hydrolase [Xylogone sp. PMI_703]
MMVVLSNISLALLATTVGLVDAQGGDNIGSDTAFYGDSPPVYPAPLALLIGYKIAVGAGTGSWAAAYTKAKLLVAQMTLEEKINLTAGMEVQPNGCSGNIPPIPRLNFPGMCLSDAGNGVRSTDFVNSYPSGLHVGAAWNKDLAYNRGLHMGGEFRTKGVNVALGPVVGPLGRVATGGRNWEGFSNDPYLCGALAAETVRGIQQAGVITSTKHFIGNEQETNRNPSSSGDQQLESVSSNIDDKTIHELYLWPFQDAVHAGSGNIMCSYNRVNNSYGCANSKTLNGLLKTELGFNGFVVSDWGAQHAGVATALAGLDVAMPSSPIFWGSNLLDAVNNGSVPTSRLDDMVVRTIAAWYQMGQDQDFPPPGVGMPLDIFGRHEIINAKDPASRDTLLNGAIEGHVLVKNTGALPLKSPKLLSLFGYSAYAPRQSTPLGGGANPWNVGQESAPLDGPATSQIAINGTIISGGGSGANSPAYINAPFDALQERAYQEGTTILWDFINDRSLAYVDGVSDACLVFINAFASEGDDRPGVHDDYSDVLVNKVANACNNTIVVIHNAGVRLVDQFADHPNVTGIIFAHLPGQDSGRALTAILYGDVSPSGKLPYSVPKNESDFGDLLSPAQPTPPYGLYPQSNFSEGVYIDYRAFDKRNISVRYEFGFGLSYTNFTYSNLDISVVPGVSHGVYPMSPILEGGAADLWDVLVQVHSTVQNTGNYDGSEVSQLYVGLPGGPVRQLRGFSKVGIQKGGSTTVEFDLMRRDLSSWDVQAQAWKLHVAEEISIWVGSSSRDLRLNGSLTL